MAEDADLADAIKRLRGEWAERSGGELVVENRTTAEVLSGTYAQNESQPPPDLLIFPSRHLGELCEAKRLRPIRKSVLKNEDLRVTDFFPQVRERLMVFGGETMALPVGCVAPVLLDTQNRLWRDFSRSPGFGLQLSLRREADYEEAIHLLMRVAPYADPARQESLFFDAESLRPSIIEPPFVRALQDIRVLRDIDFRLSVAGLPTRIRWPDRNFFVPPSKKVPDQRPAYGRQSKAEAHNFPSPSPQSTPGAAKVYNLIAGEWEKVVGEPRRVPLLATSGRLIGVTTDSRNAAAAFRLAAWLAGVQNARQLSTCSPNVANVRKSLASVADDWTGGGDKELGKQFAAAQAESLSGRHSLLIPRIIRIDDYLAALDKQVQRAIKGEATPEEALAVAAAAWEKLTDEIGRDRQRRCYEAHLAPLGG